MSSAWKVVSGLDGFVAETSKEFGTGYCTGPKLVEGEVEAAVVARFSLEVGTLL